MESLPTQPIGPRGPSAGWRDYAGAVASVAAATGLRFLLDPWLGDQAPFPTYIAAVTVIALYAGWGPSWLALGLGFLCAGYWFLSPRGTFVISGLPNQIGIGLYVLASGLIAVLGRARHESREQLQRLVESLRESSQKLDGDLQFFKHLVEHTRDAIYVVNPAAGFRMVYANEACCALFGYPKDTVLRMAIPDFAPDFPLERCEEMWQAIKTTKTATFAARQRRNGGDIMPVEVTASYVAFGEKEYIAGTSRDITERKHAEAMVREKEERFQAIAQSANDAIVSADAQGNLVFWNRGARTMFGYREEEVLGQPLTRLMPERYRAGHREGLERMRTTGEAHIIGKTVELHGLRKDGTEFPLELSLAVWQVGNETLYSGILRDITERKRTEAILLATHDQLDLALKAGQAGLWSWDITTNDVSMSPSWKAQIGYADEEIPNRYEEFERRLHPDDLDRVRRQNTEYIANPSGDFHIEFRLRHKDGTYRWILCRADIYKNEAGQPTRFTGCNVDITERKRAEESRERLAAIVDSSDDAIFGKTLDGTIVSWNQGAERMYGYAAEEVIGRSVSILIPPDRPDDLPQILERVKQGERVESYETVRITKDGRRLDVFVNISPIKDQMGNVTGLSAITHDITERKHAEDMLRETEERLQMALQAGHIGLWSWDLITNEVYFSPTWKAQIGYADEEISNRFEEWESRLHPEERERALERTMAFAQNPWPNYSIEFRLRHKDGSYRWIRAQADVHRDAEGRSIRMMGCHIDMTERKQAEEALKLFRALLDRVPDSLEVIDPITRRYLDVNEQGHLGLGYSRDEMLSLTVYDVDPVAGHMDPIANRSYFDLNIDKLRTMPSLNFDGMHRRKDGTEFPVDITATLVRLEREYCVTVVRNITERKQMEVQTRQLARLTALGQLLGGIAHALKNPLFILTGQLQMAGEKLRKRQYDDLPASFEKMQDIAKRIAVIAERFLHLAAPVSVQQARCAVPDLLQEALDLVQADLAKHRIRVQATYAPDLPETWLDVGQVREVFMSLIMNAVQAMAAAHGKGTLTVKAELSAVSAQPSVSEEKPSAIGHEPSAPVENWIEVTIQDDGPGIPSALRAKLFEPFLTTKPPDQGTGLGLWIVRSNLMMLHGTVRVESEEGQGATFIVRLPVTGELTH